MGPLERRIVIYWTLVAASGDTVACELCRTAAGIELRCVTHARDVIREEPVVSAAEALAVAAAWKDLYLADDKWAARPLNWDPETGPRALKPRTVLEQRVEERGALPRSRS